MKKIGKLVRDKIPETIESEGRKPITRTLLKDEFLAELDKKFSEELAEFIEEHEIVELGDVLEIIYAYCDLLGVSFEDLEKIRSEKASKNGDFSKRIYLEGTEE
ncbi:MAG: nucleoside triphosphate pyrophosphohydrolase [Candidatus Dojkabacteria bacterium]|nr:MAG: nucleoside triphosphate pyrophosphohydrolase [Candidatus Dojkabacteria bacterium]